MFLLLACVSFYLFFPFVPVWDLVGFLDLGISARCSARAWVYAELQKQLKPVWASWKKELTFWFNNNLVSLETTTCIKVSERLLNNLRNTSNFQSPSSLHMPGPSRLSYLVRAGCAFAGGLFLLRETEFIQTWCCLIPWVRAEGSCSYSTLLICSHFHE